MFVGYENFSTYFVDTDDSVASDTVNKDEEIRMPAEYEFEGRAKDPWFNNSACDDFVILAEFYELEGPMPRVIIPVDMKIKDSSFCLNTFVVRLMSVDHQRTQGMNNLRDSLYSLYMTELSSWKPAAIMAQRPAKENFAVCEDSQVILSQSEHGLYTYVHHFTLYDLAGRGYVRPFCLAYVTPDYDKLMNFYDELSNEFSKVTQMFKAGNRLIFLRNMTHRLSDLQYTRERTIEHSCGGEQIEQEPKNGSFGKESLATINRSIEEVKNILGVVGELLEKDDVKVSWDRTLLKAAGQETPLDTDGFRLSQALLSARTRHAQGQGELDNSNAITDDNYGESYKPQLLNAVGRIIPKTLGTLEELCQQGASIGIDALHKIYKYFSRDLVTLLLEREDINILDPGCGLLTVGRSVSVNFLSCLQSSGDGSPFSSPRTNSFKTSCSSDDFVSCNSSEGVVTESSKSLDECATWSDGSATYRGSASSTADSLQRIDQSVDLPEARDQRTISRPETLTLLVAPRDDVKLNRFSSNASIVSIADHVDRLTSSSLGFGQLHFVYQFAISPHVMFSLLIGRPVIILGSAFLEKEIRAIVNALWMFIPGHTSQSNAVVPWSTTPVTFADLNRVKLCGLGRPDKKSFDFMVSRNIMNFVTVLNLDKKTLWGPKYEGAILNQIVAIKDQFKSDASYIAYIHSKLYEIARRSFVYFHSFTIRKSASYADGIHCLSDRIDWHKAASNVTAHFKMAADDLLIVKYFVEVVKSQQISEIREHGCNEWHHSIHVNHRQCYMFTL